MLVLTRLHVHHVKQYDFLAKSVFEYSVAYLDKPQCLCFIFMTTILIVFVFYFHDHNA